MTVEEILERLEKVKREKPGQWAARCPAHADDKPSLAISTGSDGRVLLNCLAGCKTADVVKAIGLSERDLFAERQQDQSKPQVIATYPYRDESGALVFEVCRLIPKSFRQRRPDGKGGWTWNLDGVRRVLYRLPELLEPKALGRLVFVVEGEKDVDALRELGFLATCCAGGSNAWHHVATHAKATLAGRHVVVIPDNDQAGRKYAADVMASLRGSAKTLRLLELPVAEKGDVSDWLRDGGTATQLHDMVRAAQDKMPELAGIDIGTTAQRLAGEREDRIAVARGIIPYEVAFLDDALGGLMRNDLVVLTARAGAGKTQLASTIAERAAVAGRRVMGFFLEADRVEIERRIKYRRLCAAYHADAASRAARREVHEVLSYRKWMRGQLNAAFERYEAGVEREMFEQLSDRLHTVYRGAQFTLEDTERVMVAMQERVDLFVLDHLHYIDTSDEENENRAVTAIMTKLRDLALRLGKPVLLVAHLRKEDGFRPSLVPSMRELHGSSNIVKIATGVIALAPAPPDGKNWQLAATYMTVLKDRLDGALPIVARVVFDKSTGSYREAYELGRVVRKSAGDEWEPIENLPYWAERAVQQ